jgi:methyltransferase family protein
MPILDRLVRSVLTSKQKSVRAATLRAKAVLRRLPAAVDLIGCEVGVYRGEMSAAMLARHPRLRLVMVDSWEGDGQAYLTQADTLARLASDEMEGHYGATLAAIGFAMDRADIRRMRSLEAANSFPDGHFDFVFIDADHSYEGCRNDIAAWKRKVKPEGWLCGHDYVTKPGRNVGVIRAVDELCSSHGLMLETDANWTWFTQLKSHPA